MHFSTEVLGFILIVQSVLDIGLDKGQKLLNSILRANRAYDQVGGCTEAIYRLLTPGRPDLLEVVILGVRVVSSYMPGRSLLPIHET